MRGVYTEVWRRENPGVAGLHVSSLTVVDGIDWMLPSTSISSVTLWRMMVGGFVEGVSFPGDRATVQWLGSKDEGLGQKTKDWIASLLAASVC